jgi:two-component system sensor histidine kinase KdpD
MNVALLDPRPRHHARISPALAVIAAGSLVLQLLRGVLPAPVMALFYLLLVVLSAALGGLSAGLLAAVLAFLALNYFFMEPYYQLYVHDTNNVFVLLIFLAVAGIIGALVGQAQEARARAEAREREATFLYELGTALAGLRQPETMRQVVAAHLQELLQAELVEVSGLGGAARAPETTATPPRRETC